MTGQLRRSRRQYVSGLSTRIAVVWNIGKIGRLAAIDQGKGNRSMFAFLQTQFDDIEATRIASNPLYTVINQIYGLYPLI